MLARLIGIAHLPEEVAWRLVGSLFAQRAPLLIGALCCILLGLAGYFGTGSPWYLAGVIYTAMVAAWRLAQTVAFRRARDTATPTTWAIRSLLTSSATALGWAGWTLMILFEPDRTLIGLVLGIHAGLITGGSIRNNAVRAIAMTQIAIASPPLFVACLVTENPYLRVYAAIVAIHFMAALALVKFLHGQTIWILLKEREARDLAAELAAANDQLALVNEHLEEQIGLDPLTGLPNRRAFDLAAAREWRNALREARTLSVMMIDIDHFKRFNDHYGHQAGDECLRRVAATMATALQRPGDLLARYGGEEFIAILPATGRDAARAVGERVLIALAERAFAHEHAPLARVSVSIGVASVEVGPGTSLEGLIAWADEALYEAKRRGRNLVHVTDRPSPLVGAAKRWLAA